MGKIEKTPQSIKFEHLPIGTEILWRCSQSRRVKYGVIRRYIVDVMGDVLCLEYGVQEFRVDSNNDVKTDYQDSDGCIRDSELMWVHENKIYKSL